MIRSAHLKATIRQLEGPYGVVYLPKLERQLIQLLRDLLDRIEMNVPEVSEDVAAERAIERIRNPISFERSASPDNDKSSPKVERTEKDIPLTSLNSYIDEQVEHSTSPDVDELDCKPDIFGVAWIIMHVLHQIQSFRVAQYFYDDLPWQDDKENIVRRLADVMEYLEERETVTREAKREAGKASGKSRRIKNRPIITELRNKGRPVSHIAKHLGITARAVYKAKPTDEKSVN